MNSGKRIRLVVIDYFQLLRNQDGEWEPETKATKSTLSEFKHIANKFEVPVIALSQIMKQVDCRTDKRPTLGDLHYRMDADRFLFIYRDDYYDENSQQKGIVELIVAENAKGKVGTVQLLWNMENWFKNLPRA